MADYSFITARLATGAAIQSSADVDALIQSGITDVINCRAEATDAELLKDHPQVVSYLSIGVNDDGQPKPTEWFDQGIRFALTALAQPGRRVYAHCAAGVNRGPSMAFAVLRALGFTSIEAEQQIRLARPIVGLAYKADADRAVVALGWSADPQPLPPAA